jgi:hypothetical protein
VTILTDGDTTGAFYPDTGTVDLGKSTNKWAALFVSGNITVDGTVDGVDVASMSSSYTSHNGGDVVTYHAITDFYPDSDDAYDLGTTSYEWQNLYMQGSTSYGIYFGGSKRIGYAASDAIRIDANIHIYNGSLDLKDAGGSLAWQGAARITFESANTKSVANFIPSADNAVTCGSAGQRWSDLRSVKINGADIGLANGWKLREYPATKDDISKPDEWMKIHANQGIQVLDDDENVVAVIHKDGYIYCNGVRPLNNL